MFQSGMRSRSRHISPGAEAVVGAARSFLSEANPEPAPTRDIKLSQISEREIKPALLHC